jgi:hypothetical protein
MFCDAFENDQPNQICLQSHCSFKIIIKYNFDLYIMHIVSHLHLKMDFCNFKHTKKSQHYFENLNFFLSFNNVTFFKCGLKLPSAQIFLNGNKCLLM